MVSTLSLCNLPITVFWDRALPGPAATRSPPGPAATSLAVTDGRWIAGTLLSPSHHWSAGISVSHTRGLCLFFFKHRRIISFYSPSGPIEPISVYYLHFVAKETETQSDLRSYIKIKPTEVVHTYNLNTGKVWQDFKVETCLGDRSRQINSCYLLYSISKYT